MNMLNTKELHSLYPSPNIILVIESSIMRWAENVARMGERRGAFRMSAKKPDEMIRGRKREDNIKMDLQEVGRGYLVDLFGCGYGQVDSGLLRNR
jgi:hypothetical protein